MRSADGKATLSGLAAEPNKQKILQAPVTVIIGHDLDFAGKLPKLLPHMAEVMQKFFAMPGVTEATAMRKVSTGSIPHLVIRLGQLSVNANT